MRPTQQLVAGERDQVDACGDDFLHGGLVREAPVAEVDEAARAEIFHDRQAAVVAERDQLARRDVGGEPDDTVVRRVNLEEQPGVVSDRTLVILQVGAVRRPHLTQDGAAAQHDVGDPKFSADLDELTARDDDLLAVGQRLERQENRRRVVVDDQRVLGARQAPQQLLHVRIPRATLFGGQVELEVGIAFGDAGDALEGERAERGSAEIRVEDDAGGIDHRLERERSLAADLFEDPLAHGCGVQGLGVLAHDAPPLGIQDAANESGQAWPRDGYRFRPVADLAQHLVHGGKPAEACRAVSAHPASPRPFREGARRLPGPLVARPGPSSRRRGPDRRDVPHPR